LLKIPFGEATTETLGKIAGQAFEQLLSIAGTRRALLLLFDDATANQPVRDCHHRVHRRLLGVLADEKHTPGILPGSLPTRATIKLSETPETVCHNIGSVTKPYWWHWLRSVMTRHRRADCAGTLVVIHW
jgi:hypothetical protein